MEIMEGFVQDIVQILTTGRAEARMAVNTAMVQSYWSIGKRILQEEQKNAHRAEYASFMIIELSKSLTSSFGKGFSSSNLKNFRQFYQTFPDLARPSILSNGLAWSHYRLIMRLETPAARNWYIRETAGQNWTARHLERNISTRYYERLLSSTNKADILLNDKPVGSNKADFIKDPFVFEFLEIPEPTDFQEADLEKAIINHLQHFLLELGKGFSFVSRQYRITTETSHFYVDLVLYNYIIKCFVLVDLKITKLSHQDIGQMDMYIRLFDDLKRISGDQPTIGIILCADKDETVVKYSVLNGNEQLFASKYRTYLPTESELITEIKRENKFISNEN